MSEEKKAKKDYSFLIVFLSLILLLIILVIGTINEHKIKNNFCDNLGYEFFQNDNSKKKDFSLFSNFKCCNKIYLNNYEIDYNCTNTIEYKKISEMI